MNDLVFNNMNTIIALSSMLLSSVMFRILLQVFGQNWITTVAHTSTIVVLPILTFIITKVISGNIALSLGMVGALSIVRFRTPIRSPLELSAYFGAITMGIAASVSMKWFGLLVGSLVVVCLVLLAINIFTKTLLGKPFFNSSFSEGNTLSMLNIVASKKINEIDNSIFLSQKCVSSESYTYTLTSHDFAVLKSIADKIENIKSIRSVELVK